MVVFSEMADDLERTAEGIAEDEKADQQNDNSRQHKMAPEKIWSGLEKYCDFAYVHEAWKEPSFLPNEISFHPPSRQLIRLIRILPLPSSQASRTLVGKPYGFISLIQQSFDVLQLLIYPG